ncbi:MAG: hypothetical protein AAGA54_08675 [Myxococcota bacterium]
MRRTSACLLVLALAVSVGGCKKKTFLERGQGEWVMDTSASGLEGQLGALYASKLKSVVWQVDGTTVRTPNVQDTPAITFEVGPKRSADCAQVTFRVETEARPTVTDVCLEGDAVARITSERKGGESFTFRRP